MQAKGDWGDADQLSVAHMHWFKRTHYSHGSHTKRPAAPTRPRARGDSPRKAASQHRGGGNGATAAAVDGARVRFIHIEARNKDAVAASTAAALRSRSAATASTPRSYSTATAAATEFWKAETGSTDVIEFGLQSPNAKLRLSG